MRYFISNSGRYIGVLQPDQRVIIYTCVLRIKPGAIFRSGDELIEQSIIGEQVGVCDAIMIEEELEELDRRGA